MRLVPPCAEFGDTIAVFCRSDVPHILRRRIKSPVETSKIPSSFQLIGEAYVHDLMDGEVLQDDTQVLKEIILW